MSKKQRKTLKKAHKRCLDLSQEEINKKWHYRYERYGNLQEEKQIDKIRYYENILEIFVLVKFLF